jgi:hypothetical protein
MFGTNNAVKRWVRQEFDRRDDARRAEFIARLDALVEEGVGAGVGTANILYALQRRADAVRMLRATTMGVDARL